MTALRNLCWTAAAAILAAAPATGCSGSRAGDGGSRIAAAPAVASSRVPANAVERSRRAVAPVKRSRTLISDEQIAQTRANVGLGHALLERIARQYRIDVVGRIPVGNWADKSDQWLWNMMLPTTIQRVTTIGADNWAAKKVGCPIHGDAIYSVDPFYPWIIDPETAPGKVKCPIGGESYPSNDYLAGDLASGPFPDDGSGYLTNNKRYHFLGLYGHYVYNQAVVGGIGSTALLYTITGEARWAHKAGVLLLKVATEYPNATDRKLRTYLPGYGPGSGMITDVVWSSGDIAILSNAYEQVFEALRSDTELLTFARGRVPRIATADDLEVYIEDNLFRSALQALMDGRILPNVGAGQEAVAQLGLMFNDCGDKHPNTADAMEWLYYGVDGNLKRAGNQFYKDGSSYESTGYNGMRAGIINAAKIIARIKQLAPKPLDEERFPDVLADEKVARFSEYQSAITLAGRQPIAVGDVGNVADLPREKPRRRTGARKSEWLDGFGLGILRDRDDEFNAWMFFGGVRGHAHYDPLTIGLHALGRDMLPNIGYPQGYGAAPAWERSLATHQTVVVDRDEAPSSTIIGSLEIFDGGSRVQVMEAAKRPYRKSEPRGKDGPDVTDYRRMVAAVELPAASGPGHYLLDVFRVSGGNDHMQVWHGPYTPHPVAIEGTSMVAQPAGTLAGPDVKYGEHYRDAQGRDRWDPYCHFKNVARGHMSKITSVTWTPETTDPTHLRLNFVTRGDTELIRADANAPIAPDKNLLQWAFQHRQGKDGLRSQFVTVVEAFAAERHVRSIRELPATGHDASGYPPLMLEIEFEGGRDILLASGSREGVVEGGGIRLVGKFGLVRERGGKVTAMHLTEGTELRCGAHALRIPAASKPARIISVTRGKREIVVEGTLPSPQLLGGRRVLIDNHGERRSSYKVERAESLSDTQTRLTLDSNGVLGEGTAVGYEDGIVLNGPTVNMPFAGLVKLPDGRLDYSDAFHNGGHLENGKPGVSLKVRGVLGYPYQAWQLLHKAGENHVYLAEPVPKEKLRQLLGDTTDFTIYEYGVGDEVIFDSAAHAEFSSDGKAARN